MKESFFTERGIYYRTNDFQSDRKTLVFVHGLSGSSVYWEPYEKTFEHKYNVLTFDLRGHGKSTKLKHVSDYAIKNFANDIYELLKKLNIEKCILISHSFGTLVTLEFMTTHQNMLEKVVFLSPNYTVHKWFSSFFIFATKIIDACNIFPFSGKPKPVINPALYIGTGDFGIRRIYADVRSTGILSYLYSTSHMHTFDKSTFLEQINIPTLIIVGKKDHYFGVKPSLYMAKKIKNSTLHILPLADHIIVLNNAPEICHFILDFINEKK